MFGPGLPELIVIRILVLVVFGMGKLPVMGYGLGKAVRGFNRA